MDQSEGAERAFCRRQARRLLAYAESCREKRVARTLLRAAEYFLDRVEITPAVDRGLPAPPVNVKAMD